MRKLMKDEDFTACMDPNEQIAWDSVKAVIEGLLGNRRHENYNVICYKIICFNYEITIILFYSLGFGR